MASPIRHTKTIVLFSAKWLGLFWIARRLTRRGIRILCYHGGSTADGYLWRPMMFMRQETFARRMEYLAKSDYPILTLDDAVRRLESDSLPACSTVITIDDGFQSTFDQALPILEKYRLPATIYVTSYYMEHRVPVHNLFVQYLFWKSTSTNVDLAALGVADTDETIELPNPKKAVNYLATLKLHEKEEFCRKLASSLDVSYEQVVDSGEFHLMSAEHVREAAAAGFDIQLHTRRHNFPVNSGQALQELTDNTNDLSAVTTTPLDHFCYPSGVYCKAHFAVLRKFGIKSATTTDNGLNYPGRNPFALQRFVDSDDFTQLEFEAEMSGFMDLLRAGRTRVRTWLKS